MAQKSGYLYKKGLQSAAWQTRFVTLSTETGTMKFFAEKSGNKVPKGQVCIKNGKLTMLDLVDTGHAFAFEIRMEELIGKNDEAIQTLSVDDQQQLDQWVEWIGLACSNEKRKGSLILGEGTRMAETKLESPKAPPTPSPQRPSLLSSMFPPVETEAVQQELSAPSQSTDSAPNAAVVGESKLEQSAEPINSEQLPVPAAPVLVMPSLSRPTKPLARKPSRSSMSESFVMGTSAGDGTVAAVSSVNADYSPDGKNLAEKLEAKLNARRKSFKPPNFKNLLNSNGFDAANRKSHAGSETGSETDMTPPSRTTAASTPVPQDNSSNHPTSHPTAHHEEHHQRRPSHGHGHGHGHGHHGHGHGHGHHGHDGDSNRTSAAPSPMTEHHNVDAPAAALVQSGETLAPRRSFTKSPARRRNSKKATHQDGGGDSDNTRSHTPSPTPGAAAHAPLTRHLKISVRPTEPVRMGYLFRLDTSHSHDSSMGGHDVWLTQFVQMDITTGMMHVYAEINGKRLQRAKFDINESSVKSIDQLFHSRLHCFKVTYRPEDPSEKKVTAVFAAEDEDSLNYWLVSFEDCEIYFHTHGDKKHAPAAAAVMAPVPVNPAPESAVAATEKPRALLKPAPGGGGGDAGKNKHAALANMLLKRGGGIAVEDETEQKPSEAAPAAPAANPIAAALHSRFASAPANVPPHAQVFNENINPSDSTESMVFNDHLLRVNTMNMDTLLSMPNSHARTNEDSHHKAANDAPLAMEVPPPAPLSAADAAVAKLKFAVNRVKYPSERLSRRIKIWYCSSGFSIASISEVEQFVKELRNTGDAVLTSFAEEKFGDLQDWANLLAVLRKYEQRRLIDSPAERTAQRLDGITFEVTPVAPAEAEGSKTLTPFQLHSDLNTSAIAAKMSKELGATESLLAQELPRMLLSDEDNVVSQGLTLLNEDLAFAEDLILYQEEVINNVWSKYLDMQAAVDEQKETIAQLYARASNLQQQAAAGAGPGALSSISHPTKAPASWQAEKDQLVMKHYEEKSHYIHEIQLLRKSLSPDKEQILRDLRQVQQSRDSLETEVIHTQSRNDELRAELAAVKDKLQAAEEEKMMAERHWMEEIKKLKAAHESHAAQLREETRKALVQTKRAEEAVATRRNSEIAAAIQQSMQQSMQQQGLAASPPPPSPPEVPPPAPPSAVDGPKAITMTNRYASPKRGPHGGADDQHKPHKTYVNRYAMADEPVASAAPSGRAATQAPKLYSSYSYSAELKEEAPPANVPKKESPQPWLDQLFASNGGFASAQNASGGGSVNGSVSSRREELIDPEDENQEPIPIARYTPPMYPQQCGPTAQMAQQRQAGPYSVQASLPTDAGMRNSISAPNLSSTQLSAQQLLRMKRLPQSGTSSPMTPLTISSQGSSSGAPSPNPNGLQVPRSLMKSSSIRSLIQKQNSSTVKVAGPYMAPHGVAYTVAPSAESTPSSSRDAPATPTSSASASKNFMSSTKAVKINQQLTQESAKEKFHKKFTFHKTGI